MFDSALYHSNLADCDSADDWSNRRLLDLQSELDTTREELDRTRQELEVFRGTTSQILTAILTELHARNTPVGTPTEIQKLADLADSDPAETLAEPFAEDSESIDLRNRESLAYLDRRFRWLPSPRRSGD